MNMLAKAIQIASTVHLNQVDKGGKPYILHPLWVMDLTHDNSQQTYDDYIKGISTNPIAKAVKLRDLEHNSKITRLKGLRKKDFDRLEKYHRAYTYLLD